MNNVGGYIRTYCPGDIIVKENDFAHFFYILIDGEVQITKEDILIDTLDKRNTPFGILALFSGGQRTATVSAVHTTKVYQIPFKQLKVFFTANRKIGLEIIKTVITKLRKTTDSLGIYKNVFEIQDYLENENILEFVDYTTAENIFKSLLMQENYGELERLLKKERYVVNPNYLKIAKNFNVVDNFMFAVKQKFINPIHIKEIISNDASEDIEKLELPALTMLFREGERSEYTVKVLAGEVCLIKNSRVLKRMYSFEKPLYFGEMGSIINIPRTITIVTTKKCQVEVIYNIKEKLQKDYKYFVDIMSTLVERIKRTTKDLTTYKRKFLQSKDDRNKPIIGWDIKHNILHRVITEKNVSIDDKGTLFAQLERIDKETNKNIQEEEIMRFVKKNKLGYYYELLEEQYNKMYEKLNKELVIIKQY